MPQTAIPAAAPPGAVALADAEAPLGLYLHIPFCARKCPYCDFNTYAGLDDQFEAYTEALCREIEAWSSPLAGQAVGTIFVGGGTPTVLEPAQLERILETARRSFQVLPGAEISCEANPGTADGARFAALRNMGVNRLSMGAQSFREDELRFLGRIHGAGEIALAFARARAAGFENINLDLIFGLPGQSAEAWDESLAAALALAPEHLSLYSLIVEPNTPLFEWVRAGSVAEPDPDRVAERYAQAMDRLAAAGYLHYEVSNWARRDPGSDSVPAAAAEPPRFAARHNLVYWRNQPYLGLGPGAHSHLRWRLAGGGALGRRWSNLRPVPGYLRRIATGRPSEAEGEVIDERLAMGETMMLGLRLLREGVAFARFEARHGIAMHAVFAAELAELSDWGLVEIDEIRVRLTPRGLPLGNQVFARFLP